jgi:hypothetical protein|nr:MAG TPA: hypothetical protein [Caudoviricetes sp.]
MQNNLLAELSNYNETDDNIITSHSNLKGYSDFYKENKNSKIWWIDHIDYVGEYLFSFDKKNIYNLFSDYPNKLTKEEKEIFDRENPHWKDFFKDRQ